MEKNVVLPMDMGTTNTRLRLSENNKTEIIASVKIPVGAGVSAKEGRKYLLKVNSPCTHIIDDEISDNASFIGAISLINHQ